MTTITVSNAAQLTTALKSAQAGDTISLAAGNYGDVSINNYNTSVTITSQNANSPAVFHSISVNSSSNIHIDDVNVAFTPGANTYAWSSAVSFSNSSNITFTHSIVTGGLAVNGVAPTATALDASNNVQGYPTGYGINISNSNNVKVDSVDISTVNKGIVLNNATNTTISNDAIHDMRTSGIVSGGGSNITIDSNHIYDSHPWNWGNTPIGDHADFLAMWTNAGQSAASSNITITNNLMEQGSGTAVLGMWMQGGTAGFTNVKISGNAFLNGNFQGVTLWDVSGGSIDHNTLLQTSGSDWRSAPGVLLGSGTQNIAVTANTTGSVNDQSGSTGALANTVSANTLAQIWTPSASGYFSGAMVATMTGAANAHLIYDAANIAFEFERVLRHGASGTADATFVSGLSTQLLGGAMTNAGAISQIVQYAASTTSVASMTYQFFTGSSPSSSGYDYLLSNNGTNIYNLNSSYYKDFSFENRYINFAVNLGKFGDGQANFSSAFGSLNLFDATKAAYAIIFGSTPSDTKVNDILGATVNLSGVVETRSDYFAYYGHDGQSGVGTKAAMVGWLLAEAVKADVGTYALSNDAYLADAALGAPLHVNIVGAYASPAFALAL